jgi:hypothetical protein
VNDVLRDILPLAIAVTISPVPIIAEILLLFTPRAKANAAAYVAGFVVGVGGVLWALVALAGARDLASGSEGDGGVAWVKLALGVVLLVAAARRFRGRPAPGEVAATPRWMDGIATFRPARSATVGLLVGALNPKNVAMALAASVIVTGASLPGDEQAVGMVLYTLVAVLGVVAPLAVVLVVGERSEGVLDDWRIWLAQHNAAVVSALFLIFGVVLIAQGVGRP